jgi:hypothetical protein
MRLGESERSSISGRLSWRPVLISYRECRQRHGTRPSLVPGLGTHPSPLVTVFGPEPRRVPPGRGSLFVGKESPAGRGASSFQTRVWALDPVGSKIEAIEGTVPARHSLVGRRAAAGLMPQRIADLAISVVGLLRITLAKTGAA